MHLTLRALESVIDLGGAWIKRGAISALSLLCAVASGSREPLRSSVGGGRADLGGARALQPQPELLLALCPCMLGVEPPGASLFVEGALAYISALPEGSRTELGIFFQFLEELSPWVLGDSRRFSALPPDLQTRVMRRLLAVPEPNLRAGMAAVKGVLAMALYARDEVWPSIGYRGPVLPDRAVADQVETERKRSLGIVDGPVADRRRWGEIREGRTIAHELSLEADVVVVGTGAGGGMALRELARMGVSVIGLEEGQHFRPSDFDLREDLTIVRLFRDAGSRATEDRAIRVLMGQGIGGSTLHNTNLCKRAPEEILEAWGREHRISGISAKDLASAYETVERDLGVSTIAPDEHNENNNLLRSGLTSLGWKGGPLAHNRVGCTKCGFCELGCPYDAKMHSSRVLIPEALRTGNAIVWSDVRVTHIEHRNGAVRGVRGVLLDASGTPTFTVRVRTKGIVLAASAVESAALAIRSGLPDPHRQLGRHLHLHPGAAVAGIFDRPIDGAEGIPQSYECTQFLDFAPGSDRRAWIVTAFAHPVGAAASLPAWGAEHRELMRQYRRMAVLTTMIHDETEGRVLVGSEGGATIRYVPDDADRGQVALGLRGSAEILLAAGAREVIIPTFPMLRVRSKSDLRRIEAGAVRPGGIALTSVHPMGTMRMGGDPRRSVVSSTGEHHQVRGLFVVDGSLFPTSIGGPPQMTIYALAMNLSKFVGDFVKG